jgi:hypothetical protein
MPIPLQILQIDVCDLPHSEVLDALGFRQEKSPFDLTQSAEARSPVA